MVAIKKILFPTDFSETANHALSYALYFSRLYDAELHMLHVILLHEENPHKPGHHFPDVEDLHDRLKKLATQRMNSDIKDHKGEDVKIFQVQEKSISAASQILEYTEKHDIDLIVTGTHGRQGLKHLLLGSVVDEVIRTAVCPVMTVRQLPERDEERKIQHILVPVDFSSYSETALTCARALAGRCGAALHLLHIIEETILPAFYIAGRPSMTGLLHDIKKQARSEMIQLFSNTPGANVPVNYHVIQGLAGKDIAAYAEEISADLIVIATHGLTGIEHLLLGSVTERVVRMAKCPVFTVKSFGKSLIRER
jgi:nucleotide-binding universal stress UspA family protein